MTRYVLWIEIGVTVLSAVLLLVWALKESKPRFVRPARSVVTALLLIAAAVVVSRVAGYALPPLWTAGAAVVGAVAGVILGRGAGIGSYEGRAVVKPSALIVWLTALAWMDVAASVALVGPNAATLATVVALGCTAAGLAEAIMHFTRSRGAVAPLERSES